MFSDKKWFNKFILTDAKPAPVAAPPAAAPAATTSKGKSAAAKAASELKKKEAKSEPVEVQGKISCSHIDHHSDPNHVLTL